MRSSYRLVWIVAVLIGSSTAAEPVELQDFIWPQYHSSDLKAYATNLRTAGAPESVVAVLISHAVNARFAAREAALQPASTTAESLRAEFSPERRQELLRLRGEKDDLLRTALGRVPEEHVQYEWPPAVLSRLTVADRDAIRHITHDYRQMITRVVADARGFLLEDDREKIRFLEAQRSVDLSRYLNDAEILDYELAETSHGRAIRSRLQYFNPTAVELRTYLALAKKHEYHLASQDANSGRLREARKALNEDLARAWGPNRYAEYRRAISTIYKDLVRLVERLRLPPSIADEVFASQKETSEKGYKLFYQIRPEDKSKLLGDGGRGKFTIFVPREAYDSARARELRREIIGLIEEHASFARSKLGEHGFRQYEAMNDTFFRTLRNGGGAQPDYNQP